MAFDRQILRRRSRCMGTNPLDRSDEYVLKVTRDVRPCRQTGYVRMIEAVTVILSLFSAGIFLAHLIDAYRAR